MEVTAEQPKEDQSSAQNVHRHNWNDEGRRTCGVKMNFKEMVQYTYFVSIFEPKYHFEALVEKVWIQTMQEELEQFIRYEV